MTEGSFFCQEKGESRYEETIPDRPTTRGATVPPVGPRRESQHPDDLSHGRGRGASARRSGPPAARGGIGVDELGHGGGSSAPGGRAPSTASRASRASLGERRRLLRSGWAEGTDSETLALAAGIRLFESDTKRQPYAPRCSKFLVSPVNAREQLSAFIKGAKHE